MSCFFFPEIWVMLVTGLQSWSHVSMIHHLAGEGEWVQFRGSFSVCIHLDYIKQSFLFRLTDGKWLRLKTSCSSSWVSGSNCTYCVSVQSLYFQISPRPPTKHHHTFTLDWRGDNYCIHTWSWFSILFYLQNNWYLFSGTINKATNAACLLHFSLFCCVKTDTRPDLR